MSGFLAFTLFHTALSLVALAAGWPVMRGLVAGVATPPGTMLFLVTAIATSVTGFLFPFNGVLPSHIVGVIALAVLAAQLYARYGARLAGGWRRIDAIGMTISVYLLAFVLVAQAFMKIPLLHALAPTGSESAFAVAQVIVLAAFLWLGFRAFRAAR